MDAERWRRIEELFHKALAQAADRRKEYVMHACLADGELRQEVLSLLDAHENSGMVLDRTKPLMAGPAAAADFRGTARFCLIERLGEGGFGVVYSAFDRRERETVALKVLRDTGGAAIYHFKREFRSLADIVHPNLVSLLELFSDEGVWFFTMELVAGDSFVRDAQASPRSAERARSTLHQLAAGLVALHAAGKLHRDIKPANVLVSPAGHTKILDFGLARDADVASIASSARIVGTPAYMSPEALHGQVSAAGDWYAVGALLYEALTGRVPFVGTVADIVDAKRTHEPPPPSTLVRDIPSDLDDLCRDLLRMDPAARPVGAEVLRRLREAPVPQIKPERPTSAHTAFVGREGELRLLTHAFAATAERPVLVPIGGPSGIGKTTLARRFVELVRAENHRIVALTGRCFEQESIPYKAIDSLMDDLSRHLCALPTDEVETLLPADLLPLTRLFPVLHQVPAVMTARCAMSGTSDALELRQRGFAGLRTLLWRMTRRAPLVLLLDDLQWGDADSAALLRHLLAPPDPPPLLLIGCYRSDDREHSAFLKAMEPLVRDAQDARPIELEPFSGEEARALASALLSEDEQGLAPNIAEESGGSPILVELIARQAKHAPLRGLTIEEALLQRARQLPEPARRLLETVAVAGGPVDSRAAHLAAGADATGGRLLAQLRAERLVRTAGSRERPAVEAYHDRIGAAVRASMAEPELAQRRSEVARALEATETGTPELLSFLYESSGDAKRAAFYAVRSAEGAELALAFDQAARFYRLSMKLDPLSPRRAELLARLADALIHAGRGAEAAAVLLEAAAQATAEESLDLRRRAADQLLRAGLIDEGLDVLQQVLKPLGWRLAATPWRAGVRFALESAWLVRRGFGFRERRAEEISSRERLMIDTGAGVSEALSLVDNVQAAAFAARTARLSLGLGEPRAVARSLAVLGAFWGFRGGPRPGRAAEALEKATEIAERLGDPRIWAMTLFAKGAAAYGQGRFHECVELCRSSLAAHKESGSAGWERSSAEILLFSALVYIGRWTEIQERLPSLLNDARERGDRFLTTHALTRQLCFSRLIRDDAHGAERAVEEGLASWTQRGFHLQHYWGLLGRTEVALYNADGRRAWRLVQEQLSDLRRSLLQRSAILGTEVLWLYGRAGLAASRDEGARAVDVARSAARDLQESRAAGAKACGLSLTAGVLLHEGRLADAAKVLVEAARLFDRDGLSAYAAVTRRWAGRILGGEEGTRMDQASAELLCSAGVVALDRLTRLYHPCATSHPVRE